MCLCVSLCVHTGIPQTEAIWKQPCRCVKSPPLDSALPVPFPLPSSALFLPLGLPSPLALPALRTLLSVCSPKSSLVFLGMVAYARQKPTQEGFQFEASLSYLARPSLKAETCKALWGSREGRREVGRAAGAVINEVGPLALPKGPLHILTGTIRAETVAGATEAPGACGFCVVSSLPKICLLPRQI